MNKRLSCVAVDLTPVLPGGENGGAKIFVLELLPRLAAMHPRTQFVLLTQESSHEELAWLDRANVRRVAVASGQTHIDEEDRDQLPEPAPPPKLLRFGERAKPFLPPPLRRAVEEARAREDERAQRRASGMLLHAIEADVLFCPFTAPTFFDPDVPTVCTIHDIQYKTYPEFFAPDDVAQRDRTFMEACRRASGLSAVSDYSRDSAIRHGGLDPQRIRTIHTRLAHRITASGTADTSLLHRFGLAPQGYLLFPANFWRHKNHEMALTAFGIACQRGLPANVKLVCTGAPGARQTWLAQAAAALGLADRVLFPGFVSAAELGTLLANSAGMVFPSLYEGFGLPVVEAMAAGVPVACSNTTSLPEVAAGAALMFDPRLPEEIAASMVRLVTDAAERKRLVAAGRKRAAQFANSNRMAREYWKLFQDARANHRRENALLGAWADGWSGPTLNLQVAPAPYSRVVEFHLTAPGWAPEPSIAVRAFQDGLQRGPELTIQRGAKGVFTLPVSKQGGSFKLEMTPGFVPATAGLGPDERELVAMIDACSIVADSGERVQLFPPQVLA